MCEGQYEIWFDKHNSRDCVEQFGGCALLFRMPYVSDIHVHVNIRMTFITKQYQNRNGDVNNTTKSCKGS